MWQPGTPLTLNYGGIELRSLTAEDVDDRLVAMMTDGAVNEFVAIPRDLDRARIAEHVGAHDNRKTFFLGIFPEDGAGQCIGYARMQIDPANVASWTLVIGDQAYWRKGTAVVVSYMTRHFLFNDLGVHKIVVRVYSDNRRTLEAMKHSQYKLEGVLREVVPDGKGGRRDIVVFGLLRREHQDIPPRKQFDSAAPDAGGEDDE
jgi:RimJ/RimL family protein N-acetyltransferase